jgi:GT2 family glycosyltransferase
VDKPTIEFVVLNWNGVKTKWKGKPLLDFCLPTLLSACSHYTGKGFVSVIDNHSTDESVSYIHEIYSSVRVIENSNRYLFSYNDVLSRFVGDILIFVNSDICVEDTILECIAESFKDPTVFSAGPDICAWDEKKGKTGNSGSRSIRLHYTQGRLCVVDIGAFIEHELPEPHYILGACVAYRRTFFIELGGFDEIFFPYYWEDSDIAFRARERGWKNVLNEKTRAYHLGGQSIDPTHCNPVSQKIHLVNESIFFWRYISNPVWLFLNVSVTLVHAFRYPNGTWVTYLTAAIRGISKGVRHRSKYRNHFSKLFTNDDLAVDTRAYIEMVVCAQLGHNGKALAIAKKLLEKSTKNDFRIMHIKRVIRQIFISLFRKKRYKEILKACRNYHFETLFPDIRYILASSNRELGRIQVAVDSYKRVTESRDAAPETIGGAWYHIAALHMGRSEAADIRMLCRKCLEVYPEHHKCKELLESLA